MNDYEFQAAQLENQRKQMLAQQLQAQESPEGRMVGNRYVKSNPLEFLAQGLRQYMGNQKVEENTKAQGELSQKRNTALTDALRNYGELAQGKASAPEIQGNNPSAYMPAQAAQAPNMQAANMSLMGSGFEDLRKFGMQGQMESIKETQRIAEEQRKLAQVQAQQKQMMSVLSQVKSPQEALQAGVPFDMVKNYFEAPRLGQEKLHAVNGQMVGEYSGKSNGVVIPKQADAPNMATDLLIPSGNGGYAPNMPLVDIKRMLAKSGASNVQNTVSVAAPENKYNADIGAGLAKDSLALVDTAKAAPMTINNAQMIKKALDNGAITGTGAESRLAVQKALQTAGIIGAGKAENTQALMSGLSNLTLSGVKTSGLGAGNGFTDKDREFLQSAISGTIDSTPANLRRVADLSEKVARANHAKGSKVINRWSENPALKNIIQDTTLDTLPASTQDMPSGFRVVR